MTHDRKRLLVEVVIAGLVGTTPYLLVEFLIGTGGRVSIPQALWRVAFVLRTLLGPAMLAEMMFLIPGNASSQKVVLVGHLIANAALYAGFWFMLRTRHERPVWQWRAVKVGAALWLVLAAAMSAFGLAWMADR